MYCALAQKLSCVHPGGDAQAHGAGALQAAEEQQSMLELTERGVLALERLAELVALIVDQLDG